MMHFTRSTPPHAKKLASFSRSKIYQALFISTLCLGTTSVALADSGVHYGTTNTDPAIAADWVPYNPENADDYEAIAGQYANDPGSSVAVTGTKVTLSGATVDDDRKVYGAYVESGSGTAMATGTQVTVTKSEIGESGEVYGAYVKSGNGDATATGTQVTLTGTKYKDEGFKVYGAYVESTSGTATATGTQVTLTKTELGSPGIPEYVHGAYVKSGNGDATATGTTLTLTDTTAGGVTQVWGAKVEGTATPTATDAKATATDTKVIMTGGSVSDFNGVEVTIASTSFPPGSPPYGKAEATGTTLTINGAILNGDVRGALVKSSKDAKASDTKITITGGELAKTLNAAEVKANEGGAIGEANNTTLIINGTKIRTTDAHIKGAEVTSNAGNEILSATGTTVKLLNLTAADTMGNLTGAQVSGDTGHPTPAAYTTADKTEVEMNGGKVQNVVGAMFYHTKSAEANVTTVTLNKVEADTVIGVNITQNEGTTNPIAETAKANDTTVTVTGAKVTGAIRGVNVATLSSGTEAKTVDANNTKLTINGTTVGGDVAGVRAKATDTITATNTQVILTNTTVAENLYGAYIEDAGTGTGTATNNTVTINGGKVTKDVTGGYVGGKGDATGNTVTITGASVGGDVTGGYVKGLGDVAGATGNTVNLTNVTVTGKVNGGFSDETSTKVREGNTLVLTGKNEAATVQNFENYQFILDNAQQPALTTGTADIDGATVQKVDMKAGILPQVGDKITLIDGNAKPNGTETLAKNTTQGLYGVTVQYDYVLTNDSQGLYATVTGSKANPQAKALSEGMVGSVAFINQGADLATSRGMNAALSATAGATANAPKIAAFGVAQGGHSRYKTGSHVNVDGASLMLGVGFNLANDLGNFLVAPFVEGGWGNYSSHNSFNNAAAVSGGGDSYYFGVGSLFREDFTEGQYGHPYAEASLRVGRSVTKFSSKDLKDVSGVNARYRSENIYYGAHLGGGYILNLQDKATLDTYAKYFYTRQDSDNVTLSTKDKVSFEAVDSNRVRVGTRYNHNLNVDGYDLKPYVGVAFEREFSGKAKAKVGNKHAIDAPTLRGNTGMLEVGLSFKPASVQNMSIDFGVEGYTGRREGIVGSLKAFYAF